MQTYRIVTRIQDQDDFDGPPVNGQFLKWDDTAQAFVMGAAGTTNHAALSNLDYASAGHTGFAGVDVANTFALRQTFTSSTFAGTDVLIGGATFGVRLSTPNSTSGQCFVVARNNTTAFAVWNHGATSIRLASDDLGLEIRAASSQSVDIQRWTSSGASTVYSGITKDGGFYVTNPLASAIPLRITAAASQTANLTEWRNSAGTAGARITAAREFSNPVSTNSEAFGSGATTTGSNCLAIGRNASAYNPTSIAIGNGAVTANVTYTSNNIVIGHSSTLAHDTSNVIAIGNNIVSPGNQSGSVLIGTGVATTVAAVSVGHGVVSSRYSVILGYQATGAAEWSGYKVIIGHSASSHIAYDGSAGTGGVCLGSSSTAGSYAVAIGYSASAIHTGAIAIGNAATTTAVNQLVVSSVSTGYFGNGVTNASPTGFTLNATGGSGSNVAGASLTLAGGRGTGTGAGGSLVFQTAPAAGSSGSSLNSLVTRLTIDSTGAVVIPNATASVVPLVVKAAASQTANLVELQNSSGTVHAYLNGLNTSGNLYSFTGVTPLNQNGIYGSFTHANNGTVNGIGITQVCSSNANGDVTGGTFHGNSQSGSGSHILYGCVGYASYNVGGGTRAMVGTYGLATVSNSESGGNRRMIGVWGLATRGSGTALLSCGVVGGFWDNGTYGYGGYFGGWIGPQLSNVSDATWNATIRPAKATIGVNCGDNDYPAAIFWGAASQAANLIEVRDSSDAVLATYSENGYCTTRKNSAPADAELVANEAAYWFDSTNGAARFCIKAKTADGTVVTGQVTLT